MACRRYAFTPSRFFATHTSSSVYGLLAAALLLTACATTPDPGLAPTTATGLKLAPASASTSTFALTGMTGDEIALNTITERLMTKPPPTCPEPPLRAPPGNAFTELTGQTVCGRLMEGINSVLSLDPAPAGVAGADTLIVQVFRDPGFPDPILFIVNPLVAALRDQSKSLPIESPGTTAPTVLPFGGTVCGLDRNATGVSLAGFRYLTKGEVDACQREVDARGTEASMDCSLMSRKNREPMALKKTAPQDNQPICDAGREQALVDGVLTVRPGESVCLRVRADGDAVTLLAVASVYSRENVLVFRMDGDTGAGAGKALLSIHNHLDRPLRYEASLARTGESGSEYTTTSPVRPHGGNYESWPYAIRELRLKGFRLLTVGTPALCR